MVQGRLNRESNPVPGKIPGYTPQHDSTGGGDYVNTSPVNPFPINDASANAKLDALKATIEAQGTMTKSVSVQNQPTDYPDVATKASVDALDVKIQGIIDGTTPASTKVTGSNVEYKTFDLFASAGSYTEKSFEIVGNVEKISISGRFTPFKGADSTSELLFSWYLADYITRYAVKGRIPDLVADSSYGFASNHMDVANNKFSLVFNNNNMEDLTISLKFYMLGSNIETATINQIQE